MARIDGMKLMELMESRELDDYEKARYVVPINFQCSKCGKGSQRYASVLIDAESAFEEIHGMSCLECLLKIPPLECVRCGKSEPSMSSNPDKFPPLCSECRKKERDKIWVEDEKLWKFFINMYPNLNQLSFAHLKKRLLTGDKKLQTTLAEFAWRSAAPSRRVEGAP